MIKQSNKSRVGGEACSTMRPGMTRLRNTLAPAACTPVAALSGMARPIHERLRGFDGRAGLFAIAPANGGRHGKAGSRRRGGRRGAAAANLGGNR